MNYSELWDLIEKFESSIVEAEKNNDKKLHGLLIVALAEMKREFGIEEIKN